MLRYLCHVGHGYTAEALLSEHSERVERALWSAGRVLEENAAIHRRMADAMRERGLAISTDRFESHAAEDEQNADVLRSILTQGASAVAHESAVEIAEELRPEYAKKPR
jgi:two-component system chemotaxis response regulator CheB